MKAARKDRARTILRVTGGLILAGVMAAGGFVLYITLSLGPTLPDVEPLAAEALTGSKGQPVVALSAAPASLTRAFLVADDPTFLEHGGLHTGSVLRMFATRVYDPSVRAHGDRTLAQQLARVLLAAHDQQPWPRFSGALREVMLTLQLETGLSKDQLLAAYLNSIPFGHDVRGVVDASTAYFHKPVGELTVAESTTLAAMPHHPADLSQPPSTTSGERRRKILDGLLAAGTITAEQHELAANNGVDVPRAVGTKHDAPRPRNGRAPSAHR